MTGGLPVPDHARRDKLWIEATTQLRDPRSPEYMAGVAAALDRRAGIVANIRNPHPAGTAAADAWFAGVSEGHDLWHHSDESGDWLCRPGG